MSLSISPVLQTTTLLNLFPTYLCFTVFPRCKDSCGSSSRNGIKLFVIRHDPHDVSLRHLLPSQSMEYYDDLSAANSTDCEGDNDRDDSESEDVEAILRGGLSPEASLKRKNSTLKRKSTSEPPQQQYPGRIILHADVDCFYCQCEMIDRKIPAERPFAIQQKHIIVTCNYPARQAPYNVKKLQSVEEAQRRCPSLLLINGSDLYRYRQYAHQIYTAFRSACLNLSPSGHNGYGSQSAMSAEINPVAVCKSSMDEMMAEVSSLFHSFKSDFGTEVDLSDVFVCGQQVSDVTLTDDQSGVTTTVSVPKAAPKSYSVQSRAIHGGDSFSRRQEEQRALLAAARWAVRIRQRVYEQTGGFTMTIGISSNPLLAKIASGLQKPGLVNVLLQNEPSTEELFRSMPLRKLPGVGYSINKALVRCLEKYFECEGVEQRVWTCR